MRSLSACRASKSQNSVASNRVISELSLHFVLDFVLASTLTAFPLATFVHIRTKPVRVLHHRQYGRRHLVELLLMADESFVRGSKARYADRRKQMFSCTVSDLG